MGRSKHRHVDSAAAVGARIRERREARGLSQRSLVYDGCSAGYISRCERGERVPSLQILGELADLLGTTVEYLARGDASAARNREQRHAKIERVKGDAIRMLLDGLEVDSIGELARLAGLGRYVESERNGRDA